MVKLADTPALGAGGGNLVGVQVSPPAPKLTCSELRIWSDFVGSKSLVMKTATRHRGIIKGRVCKEN